MIQIFLTGGTIDKHYNQSNGSMDFDEEHISDILKQGRTTADISVEKLLFKDSLDMDDSDRDAIVKACAESAADKIVITHGTDTIVDTAKYLVAKQPELLSTKAIVLVGAMIPYEIRYSDAEFNIGFALGAAAAKDAGVYIAMNGKLFDWDKVQKNREALVFE